MPLYSAGARAAKRTSFVYYALYYMYIYIYILSASNVIPGPAKLFFFIDSIDFVYEVDRIE